ncbi:MAG: NAD(+)/NADH kinase [Coriobacteriales bacterium]|nr:NAD(+)/NADH kinase [Coriobacteriales bacterium]
MNILIVNNLSAGLRDGAIYEFIRKYVADGDCVTMRCTDGHTPIPHLLEGARGFDLIVASGGDGTIASICYHLRDSGIPILPFPAGTGNLLATNLDMPDETSAIAALARECRTLDFDLAEICYGAEGAEGAGGAREALGALAATTGAGVLGTQSGQEACERRGFALIAGAGYDASIMETAGRLKEALGSSAYIAAAFAHPNPTLSRFKITLDDEVVESEAIAVLILNFAKIHLDISITHDNDARDGLLEVAVIRPHTAVELLPALIAAYLDRTGGFPSRTDAVQTYRSRTVRVEADPCLRIQHDGEATGATTPFEARILPLATRLIVSAETYQRLSG